MAWYVTTDGKNVIGPYEDHAIINEIHKGLVDFKIRWVSSDTWRDGASHPPFAEALKKRGKAGNPEQVTLKQALIWIPILGAMTVAMVLGYQHINESWERSKRCGDIGGKMFSTLVLAEQGGEADAMAKFEALKAQCQAARGCHVTGPMSYCEPDD